ncbi:MAG: hypothetical protein N2446_00570 [Elusimicrobiales bacterium]|nr:hypothetical protein [Elusimicrobiales bacterium]
MILLYFLFSFDLFCQIVPDVVISSQNISEKKIYKPLNQRNPMVRTYINTPSTMNYSYKLSVSTCVDSSVFNIDNIVLEGIMSTSNFKEALLKDSSTGEIYIVRNGNIYTLNRKVINGYSVDILSKSIIIKDKKNGRKKEIKISNKGDDL